MRPTLTWHLDEDTPHTTPPPEVDGDGKPLPGEWDKYLAALRDIEACPFSLTSRAGAE